MARLYEPVELQLTNGIPVILQHCEGMVAATYWWVKTGSADEAPKEAGFAHFLEHMLFKDAAAKESGRPSSGQTARFIESLGGDINAYTSFDQTVYHVTCAAHQWEQVVDHFGAMAKPQRFLPKDFQREREVILEELRKNEDSPGRQSFQALFGTTFKKHPYGRPVIGFEKILRSAKVSELEAFYQRRYVSENMGILLVGPMEGAEGFARRKSLLDKLEKHFGQKVLKKKSSSNRPRVSEPPYRAHTDFEVKPFDVKTPSISLSFRVPELGHKDMPALDVLVGVLGMGELSRFYQRLFYQTSLVTDVSGGLYVPRDAGMLYFQAEMDSVEKITKTYSEMLNELRNIGENGPTAEEMERVLINAESERLYSTQTADGMAGRLGFLKFIMGDLDYDQAYLEKLREVSSEAVQEVAKRYLDYRRMSCVLMLPKSAPAFDTTALKEVAEDKLDWGLPAVSESKKKSGQDQSPSRSTPSSPLTSLTLPSGMEVRYFYRPQSHVFSIHAAVLGGLRLEIARPIESIESDWGSSFLLALTWAKGTSKLDARKIASLTEGRAASLDGFAGRNSIGLQMTGLARDWKSLSELFTDVLLDPIFPKEEVDHARRIAEDSVLSVDDHSSQLCSKLFLETLFQSHPYGRMTHGSIESLKQIRSDKLKKFHQAWVRPERLVISISGPLGKSELDHWISNLEQRACKAAKDQKALALPDSLESEPSFSSPRVIEKLLGREQIHILKGGLGTEITSDDRFPLRLLQTLLGGQSGRLFIELREKRSLAYTVSPVSFEGVERGYAGTYIACAPQKREEAELGVKKVLEGLLKKGPSKAEMSRATEFFLGRRAMDLQSDSAIASHFGLEALYRLRQLTDEEFIRKVKGISPRDLQNVCEKYLVTPQQVTSVVG